MKLTRYYNTCYNHKGITFYCSRCKTTSDEKYQDERGVWYCPNCRPKDCEEIIYKHQRQVLTD